MDLRACENYVSQIPERRCLEDLKKSVEVPGILRGGDPVFDAFPGLCDGACGPVRGRDGIRDLCRFGSTSSAVKAQL